MLWRRQQSQQPRPKVPRLRARPNSFDGPRNDSRWDNLPKAPIHFDMLREQSHARGPDGGREAFRSQTDCGDPVWGPHALSQRPAVILFFGLLGLGSSRQPRPKPSRTNLRVQQLVSTSTSTVSDHAGHGECVCVCVSQEIKAPLVTVRQRGRVAKPKPETR